MAKAIHKAVQSLAIHAPVASEKYMKHMLKPLLLFLGIIPGHFLEHRYVVIDFGTNPNLTSSEFHLVFYKEHLCLVVSTFSSLFA